jgi:shikimate kinase
MYHNIVLIGMMGSGKSRVGHCISQQYRLNFIDTDTLIETTLQMPIHDIFAQHGESSFRKTEATCCQNLIGYKNHVIATGGGMVLAETNRKTLRQLGLVIYLQASPEELSLRLEKDNTRPILNTPNKNAKIEELFLFRDPIYRETAHIIIETNNTPEAIASQIWESYKKRL